jgi:uncharacterized glyoxalase superfamily protein PhnB
MKEAKTEPVTLTEFEGHEIYPMPMFVTLAVRDVADVAEWYRRALEFVTIFEAPAPDGQQPPMVHLRRRRYQDVLIVAAREDAQPSASLTVTFNADGEIGELAERAKAAPGFGASAVEGPTHTPWNTTDVRVTDPAGNRIVFTARRENPDPELEARMKAMFAKPR